MSYDRSRLCLCGHCHRPGRCPVSACGCGALRTDVRLFQAACNRVRQPCGCASWDRLESGEWVRKHWLCDRHESTATGDAA